MTYAIPMAMKCHMQKLTCVRYNIDTGAHRPYGRCVGRIHMRQGRIASGGRCLVLGVLVFISVMAPITPADAREANENAPWADLKAQVPGDAPVYRPAYLPTRFQPTTPELVIGTFLGVSYLNSADDYLQFSIGGSNSAAPTTAEPLMVHGQAGFLTFSDGSPPIGVNWQENGQSYGIRGGRNVTRAEILQVAESLAPIGADGAFAPQCFAATGKCVGGRFLPYWLAHGGLAINGYPIGDELDQRLADGQTYRVQYFERVRLEYHPGNPAPYDILLGQFGRHLHPADPPVGPQPGATSFAATGHTVAPDVLAYWQAHGGLAQFGYPLSEEFSEQLEDGQTYTVQYFERARFERHPENQPPDDILLGQFGRRILAEAGR